jgi:hypothetical protein
MTASRQGDAAHERRTSGDSGMAKTGKDSGPSPLINVRSSGTLRARETGGWDDTFDDLGWPLPA